MSIISNGPNHAFCDSHRFLITQDAVLGCMLGRQSSGGRRVEALVARVAENTNDVSQYKTTGN